MGYLPYQLVKEFWTINNSIDIFVDQFLCPQAEARGNS